MSQQRQSAELPSAEEMILLCFPPRHLICKPAVEEVHRSFTLGKILLPQCKNDDVTDEKVCQYNPIMYLMH